MAKLTTRIDYDKANRKIRQATAGAVENWTYSPLGDVESHVDADRRTTTNTHDERRFLRSESLAGETTRYDYDGSGRRIRMQRPNGEASTWSYAYDTAGRLFTVTDPLLQATEFGYDANDNRTHVRDANQQLTLFHYDERNRLSGKTYPGGSAAWTWGYDADNNRTHSESPNGRSSSTAYDALNRPTLTTYTAAPASEVQDTAHSYDGNGNLLTISETDSSGARTETRDYDDFDRMIHVVDGDNRALHYRYDDVGNRTHRTDADGQETVWTYDALNHNTHIYVPGQGTTAQTHTPTGRLETLTRPDGSTTTHTYTDAGRIASITHARSGTTLASYSYAYDANGNRLEQQETNGAASGGVTQRTGYIYDDADRLTEVEEPGRKTVYVLDAVGNRIHETVRNAADTVISDSTLSYNDRDQLTSRNDPVAGISLTQTWDDNGNLASQTVNNGTPRSYTYDARDRLLTLQMPAEQRGTTTLAFAYHPDGLRREKSDGNTTTRYQYDDQSLLAETNTLGNTLRQYHYSATQLIAETKAGTTPTQRHYLLDALRSPVAMLTQEGAVSARTSYDAFGEVRTQVSKTGVLTTPDREATNADLPNTDDQAVGFTGYIKDSESGLYYARARYYDPATARFTTEDPEAGKDLEPPSLHRYLYAYANPTVYVDPTGRVGFLTDLRDRFDASDKILREWATESEGTIGFAAASLARAVVGVGSVGPRVANLVSDAAAQAIPGTTFESTSTQGSIEFGKAVDTGVHIASNPGATLSAAHSQAVATTVGVMEGDRGASSDWVNFFGQLATGLKFGPGLSKELVAAGRNSAIARAAARGKPSVAGETTGGKPDLRFYEADVANELENGFSRGGQESDFTREPSPLPLPTPPAWDRTARISQLVDANAERWVRRLEDNLNKAHPGLNAHFVDKHAPDIPLIPNLRNRAINGSHPRSGAPSLNGRGISSSQFADWRRMMNALNEATSRVSRGLSRYTDSLNSAVRGSFDREPAGQGFVPGKQGAPPKHRTIDSWIVRFDDASQQPFTAYPN